jgi:sugar transferase EpsL
MYYSILKRLSDLFFSVFIFIVLIPLILILVILIKSKIGSPIIFKQLRVGRNNKPFMLYKFRTMTDQREQNGTLCPDHLRLTKFGTFLRKYSLDELPQIYNVIKGDISFVGPRPLLVEYLPLYSREQIKRHNVLPGITGYAQVNGRNSISWEEKFKLDVWYVNNKSLLLDLKIIFLTIIKVLKSADISQNGHATMPMFKGGED